MNPSPIIKAFLILAAVGSTLGTALDAIHSHFGALSYPSPLFFQAAAWVPLLFSGAYGAAIARPLLARGEPPPPLWKVVLGMGLFIGAYWLTVVPWPWLVRTAILIAIFLVGFWICDRTWIGLGIAVMTAIGGPVVEIVLVRSGAFVHHEVHLLGIPGWLPFLYLTAAVGLSGLSRWLVARLTTNSSG